MKKVPAKGSPQAVGRGLHPKENVMKKLPSPWGFLSWTSLDDQGWDWGTHHGSPPWPLIVESTNEMQRHCHWVSTYSEIGGGSAFAGSHAHAPPLFAADPYEVHMRISILTNCKVIVLEKHTDAHDRLLRECGEDHQGRRTPDHRFGICHQEFWVSKQWWQRQTGGLHPRREELARGGQAGVPLKPDDSFEEWLESVPDLVAAFQASTEAFREELASVRGFGGALTALRGRHTLAVFHRRVLGACALMNAGGRWKIFLSQQA